MALPRTAIGSCHPTLLMLGLVAIPAVASLALIADATLLAAILAADAVVAGVMLADLVAVLLRRAPSVTVEAPRVWSLGRHCDVVVELTGSASSGTMEVVLDVPRIIQVEPGRHRVRISRRRAELVSRCRAHRRGRATIDGVHLALRSPLRLWRRHLQRGEPVEVQVYPNLRQIDEYGLLARTNRLGLIGIRSSAKTGGDVEFERLRAYQAGDALSRVDWKASARRDRPVVREYRTARNQTVVFLLDVGRMMGGGDQTGAGQLDHAIDALLMLAHVATSQGDQVGVLAYADGVERYLPPAGGGLQVQRLVHALHDLQVKPVESRHDVAFLQLARRVRKRALVITITSMLDEVNATMLRNHLRQQVGRHLPMAVVLRHHDLFEPLAAAPTDRDQLYTAGAAALVAEWRAGVLDRLTQDGVLVVDALPEAVTINLLNAYLDLKARHLL